MIIKTINELMRKIYNIPISENRNLLWKYFINFSAFCSKKKELKVKVAVIATNVKQLIISLILIKHLLMIKIILLI